jgi:4-coumarate--CoA ligase
LLAHPQIVDAAVIGIPDFASGELTRAYIVRRAGPEGDRLTTKEVYDYVAERLSKYKWLEGGVKFLDAIPKSAFRGFMST